MTREDCVEVFQRIPVLTHPLTNLVLRNQAILSIDAIVRFEEGYVFLRGREGGTTDEGRAFFVPYEDIAYVKIEQVLKLGELKALYDGAGADGLPPAVAVAAAAPLDGSQSDVQTPAPMPAQAMDPASIAKHNLLERIRAARTSAFGSGGKPGGK